MNEKLKAAANLGVVVMCVVWVGFVAYTVLRDRKQKPIDVLISTTPAPPDPFDRRTLGSE
jgi:hypothetical protein